MKSRTLAPIHTVIVLRLLLCVASISGSTVINNPFIGISPQDENYYKVLSDMIKCKDGSGDFNKTKLNDDFCDCLDGTDEPGTSACPEGRFYCRNVGHSPLLIFSSRVNDGICDCCDGSDEYNGQVKCRNTCWEAGKVARDKIEKKIAIYKEGVALRKQYVEQAKLAIAKEEAELPKLQSEENVLKGLVQQLKERKEKIEKLEEQERQQKENEERERREVEEKANKEEVDVKGESTHGDVKQETDQVEERANNEGQSMESTHDDQIGIIEGSPPVQGNGESENTEELSKEELGRLVASRWTGNSEKKTEGADTASENNHENHEDNPPDTQDEDEDDDDDDDDDDDGYNSETDDTGKYEDVDLEDDIEETYEEDDHDDSSSSYKSDSDDEADSSDSPSWLEKIQQTVQNLLRTVNFFQAPVDKSEADRVRKEYEESSKKLSEIQSRISSSTKKLQHDFGSEKEFYSFYSSCIESKQNKYVYKICPFKKASQVDGHSTTRLGRWDKFEDSYKVMVFSNGDNCWNGPDRSLKVRLRCGLKNELTDVDEPSRCEYVALLSTPALCLEGKLKELENKLDLMNKEQSQIHDEL